MTQIQNQDTINTLRVAARLSNSEAAPTELGKTIVPILDATPYKFSNFTVGASSTATGTITATLSGFVGDVYITSINAAYAKDSTCDIATAGTGGIAYTPDSTGRAANPILFPLITLTAQQDNTTIIFPYPIKIKSGTNVTWGQSFSLGVMVRSFSIIGFTTAS